MQPGTLYIGLYEGDNGSAACTGTLTKIGGGVEPGVIEVTAATVWEALAAALEDAHIIKPVHVIVLTNSVAVHNTLRAPAHWRPTTPGQWAILRNLVRFQTGGGWGETTGTWQMQLVNDGDLGKARELWQQR